MTKVSVSTLKADLKSLARPLVKHGKRGRERVTTSQSVKAFGLAEQERECK